MTFTYSGTALSTDLAKVRLAIGDTSNSTGAGVRPDGSNFTDEELAVFITTALAAGGTWRSAVAPVLRILSNQYASAARSVRFADYAEDFTQTAEALRKQAEAWESSIDADGAAVDGAMTMATATMSGFYYTVSDSGIVS